MARQKRQSKTLKVKPRFKKAITHLAKLNRGAQRDVVKHASNEFIRDFGNAMHKLRRKPHLVVNQRYRQLLRRNKLKLRKLANKRISVAKKRMILNQKGGFVLSAVLIPIIASVIGAAGSVAGAAASAAIMKRQNDD